MTFTWIVEAKKHIGKKEVLGSGNNPWILALWKAIKNGGIKEDAVPWCAAFVGGVLEASGIRSTRSGAARSYLGWGVELAIPIYGCVVVFSRNGGGHVGFVMGQDSAGNLLVLGGNQGDAVNVRSFPRSRVVGYRWPDSSPIPPYQDLVVSSAVQLSARES